jgi:SNF2 family DNA or RNA helicase
MAHQLAALRAMNGREYFGLFMEQGTGKTWTALADAERLYSAGAIDGVLCIAPRGVHTNWVRREIPTHLSAPTLARAWRAEAGKREMANLEHVLQPRQRGDAPKLRFLSMNIDAVNTARGYSFARRFLLATRPLIIVDESSRIKNPDAKRTERVMELRNQAEFARILSGTPITRAPTDIFSQMQFLRPGLLGTSSYRAFVAEYAELLPPDHPMVEKLALINPKVAKAQIVARDERGMPIYRNLDKLQRLLAPHTFRVLKKDCLDLPDKVFKQVYFDMAPRQRAAYKLLEDELRLELEDGEVTTVKALAALIKLRQITSGYFVVPGTSEVQYIQDDNPRLAAMLDLQEDIQGPFIVWAQFREELAALAAALTKAGRRVVQYHGGVGDKAREEAVDRFQGGDADVFLGQPQAGGIGLTLTAAETVVYYSNDFNLETRLQSEDRAHRIGTKRNVVYIDLCAVDTIDEPIARSLQQKADMAAAILGDRALDVTHHLPR